MSTASFYTPNKHVSSGYRKRPMIGTRSIGGHASGHKGKIRPDTWYANWVTSLLILINKG